MARLSLISIIVFIFFIGSCTEVEPGKTSEQNVNPNFLQASGKKAEPNYSLTLPFDHQSHPEFDIEWWYLTANLLDEAQNPYAFQWTLFRFRNPNQQNQWHQGQIYMAHTSLHTPNTHWFEERFAPGGIGTAGVSLSTNNGQNRQNDTGKALTLKLDNWQWQAHRADGSLFPATLRASVSKTNTASKTTINNAKPQEDMSIEFELQQTGPFILQGDKGYSVKSSGGKHASHYYSLPFIDIHGSIQGAQEEIKLTGKAWYDHEWTSTLLDSSTAGWDWMSLHLDNGDKLMAFSMRLNEQENFQTGTYISANGDTRTLAPKNIRLTIKKISEIEGRNLPLSWQVSIPDQGLDINVQASKSKAFNPSIFGYYEGPVVVSGTHKGEGFLELTGY